MKGKGYDEADVVVGFSDFFGFLALAAFVLLVYYSGLVMTETPTGNDKIYIYDVDFYETMTVTEKEIIE